MTATTPQMYDIVRTPQGRVGKVIETGDGYVKVQYRSGAQRIGTWEGDEVATLTVLKTAH